MPDQLLPWLTGKIEKDDLKHALWNVWIGSYDRAKRETESFGFCLPFCEVYSCRYNNLCRGNISLQMRYIPQMQYISADARYLCKCGIPGKCGTPAGGCRAYTGGLRFAAFCAERVPLAQYRLPGNGQWTGHAVYCPGRRMLV